MKPYRKDVGNIEAQGVKFQPQRLDADAPLEIQDEDIVQTTNKKLVMKIIVV